MSEGPQTLFSDQLHAEKYRMDGENFREAMSRVAGALTKEEFHLFRDMLLDMRFLPGGRIQAAMGAPKRVTPYNCYVSGTIQDSFVEGPGCIMDRAREAAATMRMGGGIGYDFSTLRPRGAPIRKLGSRSSGPIAFMEIFDAICRCVASSGHRRGAQMGVLRVDHPDIMAFIHAKQNEERLKGFNISIAVTDEFMRAVDNGQSFALRWQGRTQEEVDAQALWEAIMRSTWDWAEPGVLFIDTINRTNNLRYCETISATNPCFTGDTKVWTAEHGHVQFRDLVGRDVQVLTEDAHGRLAYRDMTNVRCTKRDAQLVRVTFDNGTSVRCTPEHQFFLKDGAKKPAKFLVPGHTVQSVYRYRANSKGYMRLANGAHQPLEHHVPFLGLSGLGSEWHAHHRNGVKDDNRPSNLELMKSGDHQRHHMVGDRNPLRRMPDRNPRVLDPDCTRGEKNGRWRDDLDTERMLEMRERGLSYASIAKECGCSKYTVQKRIKDANHAVVSVEWLDEREDVYCGTVDDQMHRFFVATGDNDGVLVANCGEQPLPPYGACLLGSFNLARYMTSHVVADRVHWSFDWDRFETDIPLAVRAMDRVVDLAVYPLPEQADEADAKRRMGLGVTGLANALEAMGHLYGSPEFVDMERRIIQTLNRHAYLASVGLAQERGAFPLFHSKLLEKGTFASTLDGDVREQIARYGLRNSHLTSIAPTGTISLCADNVSSGIEPVFAYRYTRTVQTDDGPQETEVVDYGQARLGTQGRVAKDVTVQQHLDVLLAAKVDSAVSKTCNVPPGTPWVSFKELYMAAWRGGAKGCTTFQIGGKRFGVLNAQEEGVCHIDPETGRRNCE